MKNRFLWALAALLPAGLAQAHPNPTPPPSGIVIHLFGPESITSNILPGATPAGAVGAPVDTAASTSGPYDPSVGQILHQMFVVGNPNQPPGATLSPGRN